MMLTHNLVILNQPTAWQPQECSAVYPLTLLPQAPCGGQVYDSAGQPADAVASRPQRTAAGATLCQQRSRHR
jgi:hypothetical protein